MLLWAEFHCKLTRTWITGIRRYGFKHRYSLGFAPDDIDVTYEIYRIMLLNRYKKAGRKDTPDISVYWAFGGAGNKSQPGSKEYQVNSRCRNIYKKHIDALHHQIFGYSLEVDPLSYHGEAFVKSDENATLDGHVIRLPIERPEPDMIYQRIVDNTMPDGVRQDICIPIVGGKPTQYVHLVYRRLEGQIGERIPHRTEVRRTEDVLSDREVMHIIAICREVGLDFGELDAARDRKNEKLYVFDVNRANGAYSLPREMVTEDEYWQHLLAVANAFDERIVAPVAARHPPRPDKD